MSEIQSSSGSKTEVAVLIPAAPRIADLLSSLAPSTVRLRFLKSADELGRLYDCRILLHFLVPGVTGAALQPAGVRFVQLLSSGFDSIDISDVSAHGVQVADIDGRNADAVADHALMLILASLRRLPALQQAVASGRWQSPPPHPDQLAQLCGKTVGVIGLGRIGGRVAARLTAFGAKVLFNDIRKVDHASIRPKPRQVELTSLLQQSDIITLHLPLNASTRRIIGAPQLALLKKGALIVNTARGGLIDETALLRHLDFDPGARAALDVLENEPFCDAALLTHDRVIFTPHRAGSSRESWLDRIEFAFANIERFAAGKEPRALVNGTEVKGVGRNSAA